jgi:hypothetical protein
MKRFRLPSPAMVVALGALVLSVGGNVTAAALITSAGIKDNTIRSVDIRDETIRSRDVDNGTLTGADVRNGTLTGADVNESKLAPVPNADKLDGLDSSNLIPGGVLPSKKTIRGTYGLSFYANGSGQGGYTTWSFGAELPLAPSAPAGNFIKLGQDPTANCPGSPSNPQAAPGNLCVYESFAVNVGGAGGAATMFRFSDVVGNAADRYGVGLKKFSTGTGPASSFGTWAVTAP